MLLRRCLAVALTAMLSATAAADDAKPAHTPSPKELLARSQPQEWRVPDPQNLLVMQLPQGRVLIELAPAYAPLHVANIRTMAHEHYYDGLVIERVQDNFVTQWGDAANEDDSHTSKLKPLGSAKDRLPPEYTRPYDAKLPFTVLKDGDFYAPEVGFSEGFPAARDKAGQQQWLTHCYGMVGVGRDIDPETGSGSELYAVIGQAPRALDRNIAVVGRVLQGMEYLSGLPRGTGPLGFYEKPEQRITIRSVSLASDLPAGERPKIEVLRTDSATFNALVEAKRNRLDDFYRIPAGKVDVCSVNIPGRDTKPAQ